MSISKKVLVVSQNHNFIHDIENILSEHNYLIKNTDARKQELISMLKDNRPDLTILDSPLSSLDGIREMLCIRDTLDTPVLMLCTEGARSNTVNTFSLGSFDHTVISPVTFDRLRIQIENLLNQN
jgi:DNA-binding response OmpR family regulator